MDSYIPTLRIQSTVLFLFCAVVPLFVTWYVFESWFVRGFASVVLLSVPALFSDLFAPLCMHMLLIVGAKKSYYESLGIEKTASKAEVKKAYYELAKRYHPDSADKSSAKQRENAAKFAEVSMAYSVLSDSKKRRRYDQIGETSDDELEEGDAEEMYDEILKEGLGSFFKDDLEATEGLDGSHGNNVQAVAEVNFLQSIFGGETDTVFRAKRPCAKCDGTGSAQKRMPSTCFECNGKGFSVLSRGQMKVPVPCSHCTGTGKVIEGDLCSPCSGSGVSEVAIAAIAKIPPGVDTGSIVRLKGVGHAGTRGGTPGDAFIKMKVQSHPLFYRQGDDIYLDVPLNFTQAAMGGTVTVPTLSGDKTIEFPAGVQSGDCFTMAGLGSPNLKTPSIVGAQVNRFVVTTPTDLTEEQIQMLQNLHLPSALNAVGEAFRFGAPVTFKGTSRL